MRNLILNISLGKPDLFSAEDGGMTYHTDNTIFELEKVILENMLILFVYNIKK